MPSNPPTFTCNYCRLVFTTQNAFNASIEHGGQRYCNLQCVHDRIESFLNREPPDGNGAGILCAQCGTEINTSERHPFNGLDYCGLSCRETHMNQLSDLRQTERDEQYQMAVSASAEQAQEQRMLDDARLMGEVMANTFRDQLNGGETPDGQISAAAYLSATPRLVEIKDNKPKITEDGAELMRPVFLKFFGEYMQINDEVKTILRSLLNEGRILKQDAQQKKLGIALNMLEGISGQGNETEDPPAEDAEDSASGSNGNGGHDGEDPGPEGDTD